MFPDPIIGFSPLPIRTLNAVEEGSFGLMLGLRREIKGISCTRCCCCGSFVLFCCSLWTEVILAIISALMVNVPAHNPVVALLPIGLTTVALFCLCCISTCLLALWRDSSSKTCCGWQKGVPVEVYPVLPESIVTGPDQCCVSLKRAICRSFSPEAFV